MNKLLLILTGIIITILLVYTYNQEPGSIHTVKGDWNISNEVKANNYEIYLIEEHDFDYTDEDILELAKNIKTSSSSPDDAVRQTVKYVARNIKYSSAITVKYCYDEKASDVLDRSQGDCVSMSRLVTALLRAQGIPTRTMGGCLSAHLRCAPIFAMVPGLEPKSVVMSEDDYKKRGFLHEWVEVWTPDKGWLLIEATSGQAFPLSCNTYLEYGYDSNKYNRCVIQDNQFWAQCKSY